MDKRLRPVVMMTLLIGGCIYHWLWYDYGFNIGDEGSVALFAQRLVAGERPYVDLELGYGVLWYLPLALLYATFGANFLLLKAYFHGLAIVSGLVAYLTLEKVVQRKVIAVVAAALVLLVPGSIHKSYIPLLAIANAYAAVTWATSDRPSLQSAWRWGLVVGASFLIRIDLGFIFLALLLSLIALRSFWERARRQQAGVTGTWIVSVFAGASLVQLPFWLLAWRQGYAEPMLSGYGGLLRIAARFVGRSDPAESAEAVSTTLLPRVDWRLFATDARTGVLVVATYVLPGILVIVGLRLVVHGVRGWRTWAEVDVARWLVNVALVVAGGSAFAQFFFFRADFPHLTQLMPAVVVMTTALADEAWSAKSRAVAPKRAMPWRFLQALAGVLPAVVMVAFCVAYGLTTLTTPGIGSIAVRQGRHSVFLGDNGVHVHVSEEEGNNLAALRDFVHTRSAESDQLMCFPYCPGVNVATNRGTFAKYLYVDNAFPRLHSEWQSEIKRQITAHRPRIILLADWPINGTPESLFANWAADVMHFIQGRYNRANDVGGFQVFVLGDDPSQEAAGAELGPQPGG